MRYTVRPLSDRTWLRSPSRRTRSRFTSSWSDTVQLLRREIDFLDGRDVVFEIDVQERHIRNDGGLRADARPADPAVVVAFESKHGPLFYRSDQFSLMAYGSRAQHPWQDNVRAIALTLEALRAVDRYGATETGQQYAGFKALPAGRPMSASGMTTVEAYRLLSDLSGVTVTPGESMQSLQARLRTARGAAHPDRNGGDRTLWDMVEQAAQVLGVHR